MHDCVDFLRFKNIADELRTADIALNKLVIGIIFDLIEILKT